MALDAVMLQITAAELAGALAGARVDKIFMPARDTVIINVRGETGARRLLISARPGAARVHFTEEEFDNPRTPPAFCMLLRKHLSSGRFKEVRAADGERVVFFLLDTVNEMGDRVEITVSAELMGRYSNIVLIDRRNRVIDALKRISSEQSDKRQLQPGVEFTMPPAQDKLPFLNVPAHRIAAAAETKSRPLSAALLDVSAGIGPVVCREIAWRVSEDDPEADHLGSARRNSLIETIGLVQEAAGGAGRVFSVVYEGEKPFEFSFLPLTQYGACRTETFGSVSALLDRYYSARDRAELIKTRSADLRRQVNTVIGRTARRQRARREELDSAGRAERSKLYGELITANLHALRKGSDCAELLNYYTGDMTVIPLDPHRTPAENAQKHYRDYRRQITARNILTDLLRKGEQETVYLESVRYEVDQAETEEEFLAIRLELREAGYLKSYRAPKGKLKKAEGILRYGTSDGFGLLVGKNNAANDKLTLRTAEKTDLWFHVKNGAGSHVVLVSGGKTPTDSAKTEAAAVAAYYSEMRLSEQVPVDYTEVRRVKKAPGQKSGMVTYTGHQTAYVRPDAALIARLKRG